jgi:CDP-diglyceride synthetase
MAYVRRLWRETDVSARKKVANDKIQGATRNLQHILSCDEYSALSEMGAQSKQELLVACEKMLAILVEEEKSQQAEKLSRDIDGMSRVTSADGPATKKPRRSIMFGALMGLAVACWVFSGNYIFTALFTSMTILGQLEYYKMIMNTGVYPARRISVIGASSMFLTALFAPDLHQICLPMFGLWAMIWFLTMRKSYSSIPEIAATFTGMFYLGYVPSFWVRLRLVGADMEPTRLYSLLKPFRLYLKTRFDVLIPDRLIRFPFTTGSVFIFWSWLSLAFSDVGAYFVGRKFGKTKLGAISPAAGATSPNKTVEGVVGGCVASAILSVFGAWVQKWPYFVVTGAVHGFCLGMLGLIGDLTASMLKRDAGIKDFGDLIPEHGGILDRVDSFVWSAPYSWLVCAYVIPALRVMSGQ